MKLSAIICTLQIDRRNALSASIALAVAILGLVAIPAVGSKSAIPGYGVKVAGGQVDDGSSWGIWLYGSSHAGQCWATKTVGSRFKNVEANCGFSVPSKSWQFAARGSFGSGRHHRSMLFFLTRRNVGSLNVQLGFKSNRAPRWVHLKAQLLTASEARQARLRRDFGYAVAVFSGPLGCIRRVSVFDKFGNRVERASHVACL